MDVSGSVTLIPKARKYQELFLQMSSILSMHPPVSFLCALFWVLVVAYQLLVTKWQVHTVVVQFLLANKGTRVSFICPHTVLPEDLKGHACHCWTCLKQMLYTSGMSGSYWCRVYLPNDQRKHGHWFASKFGFQCCSTKLCPLNCWEVNQTTLQSETNNYTWRWCVQCHVCGRWDCFRYIWTNWSSFLECGMEIVLFWTSLM